MFGQKKLMHSMRKIKTIGDKFKNYIWYKLKEHPLVFDYYFLSITCFL